MGTARDAVLDYAAGTLRLLPGQAAVTSAVLEGPPAALLERTPQLVRGFAGERTDGGALFRAAAGLPGETAAPGPAAGADDGRGCVLVQSLPALSRESAGSAMASRTDRLTGAADRLHWELAERGDLPGGPAAGRLAARYALCYAGAALLWLWRAGGESCREWTYEAVDTVLTALEGPSCVPDVTAALALLAS
ncbi:hypothetical protein [Streptomyces vietnamensis]|uniref:Uncharacterized protein n=1 Tax=Streptomyces vietnamensis TaxID=362257 RepID=A0A0B5IAD3_9ACTN|nr:hypothetical protein [Streptomyces vietnamensis]AJF65254.1 hypothetical protein SVTN_13360 [Streptomyces vietnamensis]